MDYIKEMRELIGDRPLLLVGTSVIAIREDMILLQKRADIGVWGYPGGYMEIGETTEESAKREFKEETGLIANENRHYTYPNGHEVYCTDIVYTCSDFFQSDNGHDDEVTEVKWFPLNNLPKEIASSQKDIIEKFILEYSK